ncbi:MAG TPA: PPC domain-containing protein [Candidatus Thermoplasmatota archaeon]|nr:PPC domain-containing protein [Candidatus Thermoplasmatota archaeon]
MRIRNGAFAATIALLLAGCSAEVDDDPLGLSSTDESDLTATGVASEEPPPPPEPVTFEFFLTTDRSLTANRPVTKGEVPETMGFTDAQFTLGQRRYAPWKLSPALPLGWRITEASFELWFHSNQPQASWGSNFGIKPIGFWYGEENRWLDTLAVDAPSQLTPAQVVHVNQSLPVPKGGYIYEPGSVPAILFTFFYTQTAQSPILLHTGGEEASVFRFTAMPYELPRVAKTTDKTHQGTFTYNTFAAAHPDAAERERTFELPLERRPAKVELDLDGSSAALNQDLDLFLLDPTGAQVWASTAPHAREGLRIYDVNFAEHGDGIYKVRIENFQTVSGSFKLLVRVHEQPAGPAT